VHVVFVRAGARHSGLLSVHCHDIVHSVYLHCCTVHGKVDRSVVAGGGGACMVELMLPIAEVLSNYAVHTPPCSLVKLT
jgi:hypothetical protein